MNWNNKKSAFTLSEIMVTLTLIGFIATMTLSTIGTSIQQRARLAEFKTAYSKMESALQVLMLMMDRFITAIQNRLRLMLILMVCQSQI